LTHLHYALIVEVMYFVLGFFCLLLLVEGISENKCKYKDYKIEPFLVTFAKLKAKCHDSIQSTQNKKIV